MMKDANAVKELARKHLISMAKRKRGRITAAEVVDAARDADSVLHGFFEWDDSAAGEQYRMIQARELIRSVRVVITTETTKIKAVGFVRDPQKEPSEQGYVSVKSIRNEDDLQRDVLIAEFTRARGALRRARQIAAAFDMLDRVDAFIAELDSLRTTAEEMRIV